MTKKCNHCGSNTPHDEPSKMLREVEFIKHKFRKFPTNSAICRTHINFDVHILWGACDARIFLEDSMYKSKDNNCIINNASTEDKTSLCGLNNSR